MSYAGYQFVGLWGDILPLPEKNLTMQFSLFYHALPGQSLGGKVKQQTWQNVRTRYDLALEHFIA